MPKKTKKQKLRSDKHLSSSSSLDAPKTHAQPILHSQSSPLLFRYTPTTSTHEQRAHVDDMNARLRDIRKTLVFATIAIGAEITLYLMQR